MASDLVTADQVTDRLGPDFPTDGTQLAALISDASALVRQAADGLLDTVDWTTPTPDVIVPVVVSAIRRALVNPDGHGSEALDDHRVGQMRREGVFLTREERSAVRRHVGLLSAGTAKLEGYMPTSRYDTVDADPWLSL